MALGVVISSNNLSGKTATVSFTPVTGYTSGSTQNLGSQIIPFNNVTSYPYGGYSIYLPEYDYTYNLNVDPDYGVNQSYNFTSSPTGLTTWGSTILDFSDFTTTIIDLNVDKDNWYLDSLYPLNEKGYQYVFMGQGIYTSNERLLIFTDYKGNILEQYSGTSTNINYDILDGYIAYFSFTDIGVLKYGDGLDVYTFTWTNGTGLGEFDNFDVAWDWDGATIYGKFIVVLENSLTGDKEHYLIDRGVHTLLTTNNTNTINKFFTYQNLSTVFLCYEKDVITDFYQNLKVYDSNGSVIETISFTENYDNNYYGHFGDNQFGAVLWNNSDDTIDYFIFRYDGNTNTYTTTTHVRGVNYSDIDLHFDSSYYPSDTDKTSWIAIFYKSINYSALSGNTVTYCDFIYTLNNNTILYNEVFQDSGLEDKSLRLFFAPGYRPITYGTNNDGNISTIQLTTSGLSINTIGPISNYDQNWVDYMYFGYKYVLQLSNLGNNLEKNLYLISSGGTTEDILTITVNSNPYNYTYVTTHGVLYWTDYNNSWYVNEYVHVFNSLGRYYEVHDYAVYSNKNFIIDTLIFHTQDNTPQLRILNRNYVKDEITLPTTNNYDFISIGRTRFLFIYGDPSDNHIHIELYDYDGNLKNSIEVSYNDIYDYGSIKDRYYVIIYDSINDYYLIYLISDFIIDYKIMDNYGIQRITNDFVDWWW